MLASPKPADELAGAVAITLGVREDSVAGEVGAALAVLIESGVVVVVR